MTEYLPLIITIAAVILIAKFILHLGGKTLIGLVINAIVGFLILWVINWTGIITIPINIITSLVVGILGIPGLLILIVLKLLHII